MTTHKLIFWDKIRAKSDWGRAPSPKKHSFSRHVAQTLSLTGDSDIGKSRALRNKFIIR